VLAAGWGRQVELCGVGTGPCALTEHTLLAMQHRDATREGQGLEHEQHYRQDQANQQPSKHSVSEPHSVETNSYSTSFEWYKSAV